MPSVPRLTGVAPMFLVDDVVHTAEWWRDTLGFTIGDYFSSDHGPHDDDDHTHAAAGEALFVIVSRDGQRVMVGKTERPGLGVTSNLEAKEYSSDAYFWVEGVEVLCEQVKATGASLLEDLVVQPYGLAEFRIRDSDGRAITFGGPPA